MILTNSELKVFVDKIRLKPENMPQYREQVTRLQEKLEDKIKNDQRTGLKVTRAVISGSWKKHTILRPTGETPIDIDLVLFIGGDENIINDVSKLHDFIVSYLEEIYPQKDIRRDVDAEGHTKSVKIKFIGSGLEVDIVPVVPIKSPEGYVWQPQRGGGGKYITSIDKQLSFAQERRNDNPSYTSIVRCLKWWRNYKELKPEDGVPGLSSFSIELIVAYLDLTRGVESNIEEGIIRFFEFVSTTTKAFPEISFSGAMNRIPAHYDTPIFVADNTNNENNACKKLTSDAWKEIVDEASEAFDALCRAESHKAEGATIDEWKSVFGPTFDIK